MIESAMGLKRLLRDRSGRLYEIPLIIAFLFIGLAVGVAQRSLLKGFGTAALVLGGLLGGLFLLVLLSEQLDRFAAFAPVRRFLDSPAFARLKLVALCLANAVAFAAGGAFLSIFLAPRLSSTPEGQLLAMRSMAGAAALLGAALAFRFGRG
jgi:hypothetical protein